MSLGVQQVETAGEQYSSLVEEWKAKRASETVPVYDEVLSEVKTEVDNGDRYSEIITTTYKSADRLSELVLQDNLVGLVFPGALLWTQSLLEGQPVALPSITARGSIRATIDGGTPDPLRPLGLSFEFPGDFHNYIPKLMDAVSVIKSVAPRLEIKVTTGSSLESTLLRAGLSAQYWTSKIGLDYDKGAVTERTFATIFINQVYYSVVVPPPPVEGMFPVRLLDDAELAAHVLTIMPRRGEIGYVRKVSYGRRIIIALAATTDAESLRSALRFSGGAGGIEVEAEVLAQARQVWQQTDRSAVVIGGRSNESLYTAILGDLDLFLRNINEYLNATDDWTPDTGAVPVSFEVRYCEDDALFSNYETVAFAGLKKGRDMMKGGELASTPTPFPVILDKNDAMLVRSDWDLGTDDFTRVDVTHKFTVRADGRHVDLSVVMDAIELDKQNGKPVDKGKTHIRTAKTIEVFKMPDNDPRRIMSVKAVALEAKTSKVVNGKLHEEFTYNDGVVGSLRGVKVKVDGKGDDKVNQSLNATAHFSVIVDRQR